MKKIISSFLKFGLGVGLLLVLFMTIGFKEIYQNLTQINILYIPFLILIWYFVLLIGSINIWILLKPLGKKVVFSKLFQYYLLTWASILVIPGRLGEFSLVYFLKKEQIEIGEGFAILVLDKLMTIILSFIISLFGIFIFFTADVAFKIITLFLLVLAFGLFFIFNRIGRNLIKKYILRKYASKFKGFYVTLRRYIRNYKKILLLNAIITSLRLIIMSFILYLIFVAFNQPISFVYVIIILCIMTILALIPITTNGLGIKEVSGVILLSKLGIDSVISTAIFATHLIIVFFVCLLNVLLIRRKVY